MISSCLPPRQLQNDRHRLLIKRKPGADLRDKPGVRDRVDLRGHCLFKLNERALQVRHREILPHRSVAKNLKHISQRGLEAHGRRPQGFGHCLGSEV